MNQFVHSGRLCVRVWSIALLLVLSSTLAFGQAAGSGTITGTITDPSGATVPKATIILHNADTGAERRTETSDSGVYVANFLQPGHYEVRAEKAGFASILRKDLTLQVGQTLSVDLAMKVE